MLRKCNVHTILRLKLKFITKRLASFDQQIARRAHSIPLHHAQIATYRSHAWMGKWWEKPLCTYNCLTYLKTNKTILMKITCCEIVCIFTNVAIMQAAQELRLSREWIQKGSPAKWLECLSNRRQTQKCSRIQNSASVNKSKPKTWKHHIHALDRP